MPTSSPRWITLTALLAAAALGGCSGSNPVATVPGNDGGALPDAGGIPDGGEVPDAGHEDAGLIAIVDWREARGAPFAPSLREVALQDDLYAATSDGYVIRSGCDAGLCDYTWLSRDGGVQRTGSGWRPALGTSPVAPDARTLSMMQPQAQTTCEYNGEPLLHLHGDGLLVDVESGQTLATVPGYDTFAWMETHFTPAGRWFRLFPSPNATCGSSAESLRRTTAPFDPAPAFVDGLVVDHELPDGRWVAVQDGGRLGLMDPDAPDSFDTLANDVTDFAVRGAWVYAFLRSPLQQVIALSPSGARHSWAVSLIQEWYPLAESGRWVLLNGRGDARDWPYRAHDLLGQFPDFDFHAKGLRRGDGVTLLGGGDLLVVTAADPLGAQPARVVDLRSGTQEIVSDTKMTAVALGDDEAAILFDAARAVLVERGGRTELARGTIVDVYALGQRASPFVLPQRDVAMVVRYEGSAQARFALDAFNFRTRRLVTLTDRLYWAPQLGWGLADELCGHPWVTRAVGSGAETMVAPSSTLFFVEYPPGASAASLFLMTADLLTPPRSLAQMTPAHCHAPLVSRDGRHAAMVMDGYDTEPRRWAVAGLIEP